MIKIITDSTADLNAEIAEEFDIHIVPLSVAIGGKTYRDGDLQPSALFGLVQQSGELPKTAAPAVIEFEQAFRGPDQSIYIGVSSQLSATIQNAQLAARSFPEGQVRVIDSLNLSTGIGLLVLLAAELRRAGLSVDEIESRVCSAREKVRTAFMVETMEYLYKGGRCTAIEAIVGSLLKIRPVIRVDRDGTMSLKEKVRGSREKALQTLLAEFEAEEACLDRQRVFVTHSGCDADAELLASRIRQSASPREVRVTLAGSVISSHCGPDTIGILYLVH